MTAKPQNDVKYLLVAVIVLLTVLVGMTVDHFRLARSTSLRQKEYVVESQEVGDVCARICNISPNAAVTCTPIETLDQRGVFHQIDCRPNDAASECWYHCVAG